MAPSEVEEFRTDGDIVSPTDLSEVLKEGTKESHDRAENTQFVKDFLKGKIHRELFKLGTVALYYTYSALEEEMDKNAEHPAFAPLYFPLELHRKEALAKDLEFLWGPGWKDQIECSEATRRYVERIHHVGEHEPELLAAHAYTRYMGDLSGGQVLKKVAQRALRLPSTGEGVLFYTFDNISNPSRFKQLYRSRLNNLETSEQSRERLVEEANQAFRFNMEVFEELDKIGKTLNRTGQEDGIPLHDGKGDAQKCPFYAAKGNDEMGCPLHQVMAIAQSSPFQLVLAVLLALVASWYLL
ncbi:heme oxygenase 2-like [Pristis pectinata]|uniref:heme oxygenase 2-like n=1 Tax=Pristis pectinata TaxID=685728 RepID=UPI00223E7E5E|nr:heme oxygenase 2-like [Pristis pectinata]XP_051877475.1 heme oxygenase 2-like [Pristis pectinata]